MRVTVIGCGNAGLIHAAKLMEKGHEVALLKTSHVVHDDFFSIIRAEGGYNVKDETSRGRRFFVHPKLITTDVKQAVEFGDVLFVFVTTLQHEYVAQLIAPYVREGQLLVLVPGYMGSFIFRKYISKNVTYSEWETTAYNGRIVDSMYVRITFYNPRNAISVWPIVKSQKVLDLLGQCFDNTKYLRKNILESALHNPNMIVHTIGTLLSASRIEYSQGEFWMYKEAFTPSVVALINAFDRQKNAVLEAYGCGAMDYFEAAKWRNEEDLTKNAMEVFRSFAESSNKGPSSLFSRYLLEDVPMGLCLFSSLGRVAGVSTSIADSLIALASALLGRQFMSEGRTIEYLLDSSDVEVTKIRVMIEG